MSDPRSLSLPLFIAIHPKMIESAYNAFRPNTRTFDNGKR